MKLQEKMQFRVVPTFKRCSIFAATMLFTTTVLANPVLNNVAAGNIDIQQLPNSTVINQSSQKAIINWQSFNIGAQESTHFQQPVGGIALNRISPTQGASSIYGSLTATGQIILVNPAGLFFGPSAYVNVGGLIASTADISNQNFLNGNYQFTHVDGYGGSIINQGTIIAANNGLIALIGNRVSNEGLIQAKLGKVVLASGHAVTLSFAGNDLINFAIDQKSTSVGGVNNTGSIIADGGTIIVSAKAAQSVLDNVINMEGVLQARSVGQKDGEIILLGDTEAGVVRVAGDIDVSGKGINERGGNIKITGYNIWLDSNANLDASGSVGGGNIYIGGNYQGKGPLPNANALVFNSNARLAADALTNGNGGEIILWSDFLTKAYGSISARGGVLNGDGGFVETSSHGTLDVNGARVDLQAVQGKMGNWLLDPADLTICTACSTTAIFASDIFSPDTTSSNLLVTDLTTALNSANIVVMTTSGGSGGLGDIIVNTSINWTSANSLTLSAYHDITVSLANSITNTGGGSLVLRADNTGTGSGTVSFGTGNVALSGGSGTVNVYYNPTTFGTQDTIYTVGLGTTPTKYMLINSLGASGDTTTRSLASLSNNSGFWSVGNNYALAKNIDASATSGWNSGAGFTPIGVEVTPFAGQFDGQGYVISNLYINAPFSTSGEGGGVGFIGWNSGSLTNIGLQNINVSGNFYVGGLAGQNNGTITNSYSTGSVSGAQNIGGLVGQNYYSGSIVNSYSSATVTSSNNAFYTGALAGGLSGYNYATISNSYATGNVIGVDFVGGLVGYGYGGSISNAYATGNVTASGSNIGGFLGYINGSTINNSFWDTATTGQSVGVGGTGPFGGTINNLTGGCFTGSSCANGVTANLSALATYSGVGWNITSTASTSSTKPANTWFIFGGNTRPMLLTEQNTTINNAHQLQLMGSTLGASYTLGKNIDASSSNGSDIWGASGFMPVGDNVNSFTGSFEGNNYEITSLYINRGSNIGLFGQTSAAASISNLTLNTNISGVNFVGGLVGVNNGTITNVNTSGSVSGSGTVGGLVGSNAGTVTTSSNAATVVGSSNIGGLVGVNTASGSITNSYNTGAVGGFVSNAGGLVGANAGSILRSYNSGYVSGPATNIGGLVAFNSNVIADSYNIGRVFANFGPAGGLVGNNSGSITNTYSIGIVNGGGLVGSNSGSVNSSYWDTGFSGVATSSGGTAETTTLMFTQSIFTGWDFATTWGIISGQSYPYLKAFYAPTPRAISGSSNAGSNNTVTLAVNGSNLMSTQTGANGFYYFLLGNGVATDGSSLLAYLPTGTSANGITLAPTSGGSLTGFNLTLNAINVGDDNTNTISNTILATAKGSLSGSYILYSASGNNLTLGNVSNINMGLNTTANTTYSINGNLSAGGTGSMVFNGPAVVSADSILTAASGSITFNGFLDDSVNLGHMLTATANAVNFNADVGNSALINNLTVNATTITDNTPNLDFNVGNFNGAFLIKQPAIILATGSLTFGSTIDSFNATPQSLMLFPLDSVNFQGNIGTTNPLDFLSLIYVGGGNSLINFNGASQVTTNNNQTYVNFSNQNALIMTLANDLTFTTTNSPVVLEGSINATTPHALTINAGSGTIHLNGDIGAGGALSTLNANSTGLIVLGSIVSSTMSAVTTGAQSYVGPVTMLADTTLTGDGITFGSTLDSDVMAARALTVNNPTSDTLFSGSVGATNALSSITTDAGGRSVFGTNSGSTITVTTTGTQIYNDAVVLNDNTILNTTNNAIDFNNNGVFSYSSIRRNLTVNTGSGNIASAGFGNILNRSLGAIALNSSGITTINGTTLDANSFTTDAGGTTVLNGFIDTITAAGITFNDNVLINSSSAALLTNGGPITFAGTLDSFDNTTAQPLTIQSNNVVTFAGAVGATNPLGALSISPFITSGTIAINGGSITTNGVQTYGNAVQLGANTTLTSNNNAINIQSSLNSDTVGLPRFLTINAGSGDILFAGIVGGTSENFMAINSTGTTTINAPFTAYSLVTNAGGSTIIGTNSLTNTGVPFGLTFNDAVRLNADPTFTGYIINFNSTLDSFDSTARSITINPTFRATFGDAVGNNFRLNTINITPDVGGFIRAVNDIKTTGSQSYNGDLQPTGNVNFNSSGGDISFGGRIESSTPSSVTAQASGAVTFANTIGTASTITDLIANGLQLNINTSAITTSTSQQYTGAVVLGANPTLSSGSLTFSSSINSDTPSTLRTLQLIYTGNVAFGGDIGVLNPLNILTFTPSGGSTTGIQFNGANQVTTISTQNYADVVTLSNNPITFTSTSGDVSFGQMTVNNNNLVVQGNNINFNGPIIGVPKLGSLTLTASNNINFMNNSLIDSTGDQLYSGQVVLGAGMNFVLSGSGAHSITFNNGISGNVNAIFTGNADTNTFNFQGPIALQDVTVSGSSSSSGNSLIINSGSALQTWNISGTNAGNIVGVSSVSSNFNYDHIQNIVGGNNDDIFALVGGTLAGNIAGGGGTNTLVGNNVANQWTITNLNGGSVTGIGGVFSNIQNITGGNQANTYAFVGPGSLSGYLNGGVLGSVNTLDFMGYNAGVNIMLSSQYAGVVSNWTTTNLLTSFGNINNVVSNIQFNNNISLPNKKSSIVVTGPGQGFIGDPLYYNGFSSFTSLSALDTVTFNLTTNFLGNNIVIVNGQLMVFTGFPDFGPPQYDVSKIIQQPTSNSDSNGPSTLTPGWLWVANDVSQNLDNLTNQAAKTYDDNLNKLVINPFCYAGS